MMISQIYMIQNDDDFDIPDIKNDKNSIKQPISTSNKKNNDNLYDDFDDEFDDFDKKVDRPSPADNKAVDTNKLKSTLGNNGNNNVHDKDQPKANNTSNANDVKVVENKTDLSKKPNVDNKESKDSKDNNGNKDINDNKDSKDNRTTM